MFKPPLPAISLVGLARDAAHPWNASPRAAIAWAGSTGARALAIDATAPATRPRNLDRSARRDLAASMRRSELASAGIDLFIPPEHFIDDAHADRAVSAVLQGIELARELAGTGTGSGEACLSIALPAEPPAGVISTINTEAGRLGVIVADHAPRDPGAAPSEDAHSIGIGVDPAVLLREKLDPVAVLTRAGDRLGAIRLSDASAFGRCPVDAEGSRLDVHAYAIAAATVGARFITLDLRGVADQDEAARGTLALWRDATALPGL
ncbi:MAG: hypothetical protein AAF356_04025 [Planctomycetota bacterium]